MRTPGETTKRNTKLIAGGFFKESAGRISDACPALLSGVISERTYGEISEGSTYWKFFENNSFWKDLL